MKLLQKIKEILGQNSPKLSKANDHLRANVQKSIDENAEPIDLIFKAKLQETLKDKLKQNQKTIFSAFSLQWIISISVFFAIILFLTLNVISIPPKKPFSDNFFDKAIAYYLEQEKNKLDPNQIYYQKINFSLKMAETFTYAQEIWQDGNGNRLSKDNFNKAQDISLVKHNLTDGTLENWTTYPKENFLTNEQDLKDFLNQVNNIELKEMTETICLKNIPAGYISQIHIPNSLNKPIYIHQEFDHNSFQGPKAETNIMDTLMNNRKEKNLDEIIHLFQLLKNNQNIEDNGEKQEGGKNVRVFTLWYQKPGYNIPQGAMANDHPNLYSPGEKFVLYFDSENYEVIKAETFTFFEGMQRISTQTNEKQGYITANPDQIFNPQAYNLIKIGTELYDLGCFKERKKMTQAAENDFMNNLSETRKKEIDEAIANSLIHDSNQHK